MKIYYLENNHLFGIEQAGQKINSLAVCLKEGYPVLSGWIISDETFQQFIAESGIILPNLGEFTGKLVDIFRKNQEIIENTPSLSLQLSLEAQPLIIRSSLTLSNVKYNPPRHLINPIVCHSSQLSSGVKKAWLEVFRVKSLFYWQKQAISWDNLGVSLLIQPLYPAVASGKVRVREHGYEITAMMGLYPSWDEGTFDCWEVNDLSFNIRQQKKGNQTFRYEVNSHGEWVKIPLSSEEKSAFCLTPEQLQQFIPILHCLKVHDQEWESIEWTIPYHTAQVLITQVIPRTLPVSSFLDPILSGNSVSKGEIIAPVYQLTDTPTAIPPAIPPYSIIVGHKINPNHVPFLRQAVGFISEEKGINSHTAILARELNIPAIIDAHHASKVLKSGDWVYLNGYSGKVYSAMATDNLPQRDFNLTERFETLDIHHLGSQLWLNVNNLQNLAKVKEYSCDGIGMLRAELLGFSLSDMSLIGKVKSEEEFVQIWGNLLIEFAIQLFPKPIFYRLFDWRDEVKSWYQCYPDKYEGDSSSHLFDRGTAFFQKYPYFLQWELATIDWVYQQGFSNINIVLPFVRGVNEFIFCRDKIKQYGFSQYPYFQLWIMAEVPSVAWLLPEYIKEGVQGITIGTNDLTPLVLGVSPEQISLTFLYNEEHPAVLSIIQQLIKISKSYHIPCLISGRSIVNYPHLVSKFIEWQITGFSVEIGDFDTVFKEIYRVEKRLLLDKKLNSEED